MDLLVELLPVVGSVLGAFAVAGLLLWSITTIRYHIDPPHLRITWLGLPVRRIPLDEIRSVGHRPVFWAERWINTLHVGNRWLVLRRREGFFKTLIITPKNYMVFKAELERARKADPADPELVATDSPSSLSEAERSG